MSYQSSRKREILTMKKWWLSLLIGCLLVGCSQKQEPTVELNVSAASSLQEAMQEIAADFMELYPNVKVQLNFGGSNVLKTQIVEGFDVDLFLSANFKQYDELVQLGKIEAGSLFATNRVVIVTNNDQVQSVYDLAKPNLQVVLANESVPIGQYAASIIDSIDENEPGFKAAIDQNIVSREENVRQVLMKITLNEGDAAFVYQTDLTPDVNDQVTVVYLPNEYDVISEYYMGIIKQNEVKKEAEQLYEYILSDAGQEVLKSYGYE